MAPTKGHQRPPPGAPLRHHVRTSSGGSSKLGLHLHFTQKDPTPYKHHDQHAKRSSTHQESYTKTRSRSRSPSPVLRAPSAAAGLAPLRTQSKDYLPSHRSALGPSHQRPHSKHNGTKSKADFTLASPVTDDDDDWVSSESGERSESDTKRPSAVVEQPAKVMPATNGTMNDAQPRSETPLARISTSRPATDTSAISTVPRTADAPAATRDDRNLPSDLAAHHQRHRQPHPHPEEHGQAHLRHNPAKRQSSTRPSSMYSITNRSDTPMIRPHPLIRGLSNSLVIATASLAPLTITPDSPSAQLSASPPLSTHLTTINSHRTSSPTAFRQSPPSSPIAARRTSISSARSVATLPVTFIPSGSSKDHHHSQSHLHNANKLGPDRHRTISTLSSTSSASSSAALSSLAHLPSTPRSVTPQLVSYFPPVNPHSHLELIHPLLPSPYLATHLTVLSHRTPLRESYDRVIRAKQGR